MKISLLNQVLFVILVLSLISVAFFVGRLTTEKQLAEAKGREEAEARKEAVDRSFSDITERAATMSPGTTDLKYCLRGELGDSLYYGQVLFKVDNSKTRPIAENSWLTVENIGATEKYTLHLAQIFSFPRATKVGLRTIMDFGRGNAMNTDGQLRTIRASIFQETTENSEAYLKVSSGGTNAKDGSYQIKGAEEQCD